MYENEAEGDLFDDEGDLGAPESAWTNIEESLVKGAYDSVAAAYQLLLDWSKPAHVALGDNEEVFHTLAGPLSGHYEQTVRRSADLLAEFFLESGTRGPRHQRSMKLREEAVDVLSGCIQAFAACAEFGAKALSDQGSQCIAGALGVLPDTHVFGVFMRFLSASSIAIEIAELARHGFAEAVRTRARSLHETAITAMVVQKYAKRPELEVVDRFWEYQYVRQYKGFSRADRRLSAMRQSSANLAVDLGDSEEGWRQTLKEAKKEYDRVISRYGKEFAQDYGWARNLVPADKRLTFGELETLAGGGLDSLDYMLASAYVHPSYVLNIELVSALCDGLRHANTAWLHLVQAALSLLEEEYPTPEPRLHKAAALALFGRTDLACDDAGEWIRERREELDRLEARGEEAVKKHIDSVRAFRQSEDG